MRCLCCSSIVIAWVLYAAADTEPNPACSELLGQVELWGQKGLSDVAQADLRRMLRAMRLETAAECGDRALAMTRRRSLQAAAVAEEVANHPSCVDELFTKGEAQTRCAQKWYKIAIQTLLGDGETAAAAAAFQRATELRAGSAPPFRRIAWPDVQQTPTLWLSGLRSARTWDCNAWPFVRALEARANEIHEEILAVSRQGGFSAAYPYLSQNGTWQKMFLFQDQRWDMKLCKLLPLTCRLLVTELPTKIGVPYATPNNEEVVIFRTKPGASVGPHSGASNNQINLHLTLAGAAGTFLRVGGEEFQLHDRRTICFQDSYVHSVEHRGDAERISLVVRVMHPDMHAATYGGSSRTDAVDLHQ